jgi:hypothetical protein
MVEASASQLNKDHSEGATTFKTSTTTDHTGTAASISTTMADTEKLDVVDPGAIQASTPMQRMWQSRFVSVFSGNSSITKLVKM